MTVTCEKCNKSYRVDPARFAGKDRVKVKCPSCQTILEADLPQGTPISPAPGAPPANPARVPPESTTQRVRDEKLLSPAGEVRAGAPSLPQGMRISLAILSGPDQGKIVVLDRPKMVLGRSDSDVLLADPEISRQHAVVEIYRDKFLIRDLDSTNGTFVGDRRITAEEVENHGEFRVGGSRMMLIVTTPEE
jgi:predicted Zn finger-like uncharacterized protein